MHQYLWGKHVCRTKMENPRRKHSMFPCALRFLLPPELHFHFLSQQKQYLKNISKIQYMRAATLRAGTFPLASAGDLSDAAAPHDIIHAPPEPPAHTLNYSTHSRSSLSSVFAENVYNTRGEGVTCLAPYPPVSLLVHPHPHQPLGVTHLNHTGTKLFHYGNC